MHESHQGSVRTKQSAKLTVYWPGIDNDIENTILACKTCQDSLPSNPREPLTQKAKPTRPFQAIAADICTYAAHDYLILVDCYSDWPDIIPMGHNTTTPHFNAVLRQSFCRIGVPDILWSSATLVCLTSFGLTKATIHSQSVPRICQEVGISTPHILSLYSQSNGKAEATVKSMKKLIRAAWTGRSLDEDTVKRALLQYQNTPSRKDGLSPAQKLFGQPIQDALPAHRRSFALQWQKSTEEARGNN